MWQRLEALVTQTHEFVKPTRTSIYWYEPERRYFWRRVGNRTPGTMAGKDTAAGITVQEAGGFYSAMVGDQLVSIGEAQSSLKADVTSRLLQRLGVRSLLAAPILLQEELLGFLAVEGNDPRIWQDEEKNYIRSAAKLVAMLAPIEQMEATIEQTKQDQILTAELAHAIATEEDGYATLKTCAERLFERLQQVRFLVVLFDRDLGQFEICYQTHPPNRQPLGKSLRFSSTPPLSQSTTLYLPLLSEVDWQWIERSRDAVEIEDLSADLKIMAWRDELLEMGARSLILCNTSLGRPLEAMLILAYETPRTWTSAEREIIRVVAGQLGVILHQWQLQRQTHRQQHLFQTLQEGLTALATNQPTSQYEFDLYTYERAVLQPIAQMLAAPCVVLITWSPGEQVGRMISARTVGNQQFSLSLERLVPLNDELIQAAIVGDGLIAKNIDEVSSNTRQWLNAPGIGEILAIALQTTPEHEPMGVVVVCDERGRHWPESALPVFGLLVTQLAWYRRYLRLTLVQASFREELEQLNWYKHRFLEEFHRSVEAGVKNLFQMSETFNITSVQRDAELFQTRVRQICQQLGSTLNEVTKTAEAQMWKMRPVSELTSSRETVSITSMLRRSLERVDTLLKESKLWSQVREAKSESPMPSQFSFTGELLKIELILHEILVAACQRAPEGGRIDIWYRLIANAESSMPLSLLELSITDNGTIDPQLVTELKQRLTDELAPSTLNQPPGLHLRICQSLVQQIGGQLKFYQVEDGRVLTRLLLPIVNG
jgi:GAF domain-containing protein